MCIHSPCSLMCFFKHTYVWFYFSCILYLVYAVASRFMSQHTERNRISTSAAFYAGSERNCPFINTSRAHLDRKCNFDSAPRKSVKSCFLLIQQVLSRIQFPRDNCIDDIYRWADGHGPGCWISTAATSLHPSSPSVTPPSPRAYPEELEDCLSGLSLQFWPDKRMCTYWIYSSVPSGRCICWPSSLILVFTRSKWGWRTMRIHGIKKRRL